MTRRSEIDDLLAAVAAGDVAPSDAAARLASLPFLELGFATVDTHRELRQGAPEAILAEGKTTEQVVAIASALDTAGASSVLVTRASAEVRAAVREAIPAAEEHELARAVWVRRAAPEPRGLVVIVSGGTSDGSVVHEARIRAELLGVTVVVHEDVGAAGIHRLGSALPDIMRADCVVVVAGMDAALATVVGGLAPCP
ncbi:MAG: nickel pincer cofactor biosynthesis protein LarB, partial [Actinomycetota bacterium]